MNGKYKPTHTCLGPSAVGISAQQNCDECHGINIPTAPKSLPKNKLSIGMT
ncbi:MAG: hypothetical protein ACK4UR_02900 [Caldimicrobium sp.]